MEYRVELVANARVDATVYVEAASKKEAEQNALAIAKAGGVSWTYSGADDASIEAEYISKLVSSSTP